MAWKLAVVTAALAMAVVLTLVAPSIGQTKDAAGGVSPAAALDPNIEKLAAQTYKSGELKGSEAATGGGRTKVRQLYGFEEGLDADGKPVKALMATAENCTINYCVDAGVTEGKGCARWTIPAGGGYGMFILQGADIKDWNEYDYFAMDLYTDDANLYQMTVELWDGLTKGYPTRCGLDAQTHQGKQTVMFQINRAKRNGKEGREWNELEPQDKMKMDALTKVKIFTTSVKDHPAMFWIDNLRLLQEDAAKPKMSISLPANAIAFDFCSAGAVVPGFKAVTAKTKFADDFGFVSTTGLVEGGKGWPDLLSGTWVSADTDPDKKQWNLQYTFKAKVPSGDYKMWLCAGPILDSSQTGGKFILQVNDKTIDSDTADFASYDSEKYLYRYMSTQYSERPHALWLDYINKMFPVTLDTVKVTDGTVTITASNYFLSGLILVPAADAADADIMAAKIAATRMSTFEKATYVPEAKKPAPAGGEDYALYVPRPYQDVGPSTGPAADDLKNTKIAAAGAPGQNVFARVAVVAFKDLGDCQLKLADLSGPDGAKIPASAIQGHFVNYRYGDRGPTEMILLPTLSFHGEKGITQCLWLWLSVPADAKPGKYAGTFAFAPGAGKATDVPVEFEVYPIKLESDLPVSFGMYYGGRGNPTAPKEINTQILKGQYQWMKKIGLTATALALDPAGAALLKECGFGQKPGQLMMTSQLGIARGIGRQTIGAKVDQNPGSELKIEGFKAAYAQAIAKHKKAIEDTGMNYACEIVDEPREVPNPWNRNLEDTCTYGDLMAEAGIKNRFTTPMGDGPEGSYTKLVEHADIISVHAWAGSKLLMEATKKAGKTLWFYNTGMGRLEWGAYTFAQGATGRWEWHWCYHEGDNAGGYAGSEWYNPFTSMGGMASNAPSGKYPGGFLYRSGFLTAADGITDYNYFYTLGQAIKKNADNKAKADAVTKAKALLDEVKAKSPEYPHTPAAADTEKLLEGWRDQAARLLIELQK
jgi:hypothetical protein